MTRQQKITFGKMRESGVRSIIIHCSDFHAATQPPPSRMAGRMM
jgi:hypothetical protein